MLSKSSKPVMSGKRKSSTTQSTGPSLELVKGFKPRARDRYFDVFMAEQLHDAELLRLVVLDDQKALLARLGIRLDTRQFAFQMLLGGGLGHERKCAARQPMLTILVERDDLHRDMPGQRILFELAQHAPAQHVGQEYIERHRRGLILLRQFDRISAARGKQHLEPRIAGEVHHDPRIMRIVFDDQQNCVARHDFEPVVRNCFQ